MYMNKSIILLDITNFNLYGFGVQFIFTSICKCTPTSRFAYHYMLHSLCNITDIHQTDILFHWNSIKSIRLTIK